MHPSNLMELCRLCLVKDKVQIPIFEGEGDVRQIFLKIAACLPVKVKKDDKLPKKICDECLSKVESLYQFWNTTANAEKQLLQWLGEAEEKKTDKPVKREGVEPDQGSELANSLSRVEAVLAEARDADSDGDNFADTATKDETDDSDDDVPLSSLEVSAYANIANASGPSTSAVTDGTAAAQSQPSGEQFESEKKRCRKKVLIDRGGPRKCKECDYVGVLHKMIIHERRHSGIRPFKCKVCNKSFTANGTLTKHYLTHVNGTPFECDICHKKFKLKNTLYVHKKMHSDGKIFGCTLCNYAAYQKSNLDLHMRRHYGDYKYICSECNKGFYLKLEFENHLNKHSGEKPFACSICGKSYPIQSSLIYHMTLHEGSTATKAKKFQCKSCNRCFSSNSRLEIHQRTHTGARPFSCHFCGRCVATKDSLNDHIKLHTGERPYKCNLCIKTFIKKTLLKAHERSHTGEKPFHCIECGKDFTQQSSLSIHMKSHMEEKPYKCDPCCLSFVSKTLFITHQKSRHPPPYHVPVPHLLPLMYLSMTVDKASMGCGYFIQRKKRQCRMTVAKGAFFCGEHGNGERIACPLDPKHSCFVATLQKHLRKCNASRKENRNFIVPQINAVLSTSREEDSTFQSLGDLSDLELSDLVEKIEAIYKNIPECETSVMVHSVIKPSLEAIDCGAKAKKHLLQNASLLANIEKEGFLECGTIFVEFGAGRGQLSFWLGEVLQGRDCNLLLVDKASNRHKLDNKLKDGNIPVTRVRADIADLDLLLLMPPSARVVGICKHLCGEATDLSLRCLLRALKRGMKVEGLIMAPCCHHRCSWHNFVGRDFLQSVGLDQYVFKALCGISSWATCGTGRPRKILNSDQSLEHAFVDRYARLGYDQLKRKTIGRMAKMILNFARLKVIEDDFQGKLFYYTDESVSPENVCYLARSADSNR